MRRQLLFALIATAAVLGWPLGAPEARQEDPIHIMVGTVVPTGTAWEETLRYMQQEWQKVLGPRLKMTIRADSTLGDETALAMKLRAGQVHIIGVSSTGLSRIDPIVNCLQIPFMFDSWEELDYVHERVSPRLEKVIESRGYKVLHWADGGWVYPFSNVPAPTPDAIRKLRLFTASGDPTTESLYQSLGFNIVVLPLTDVPLQLQRGQLDAVPIVPLFALTKRFHERLNHMTNIRWLPLVGATIISAAAWERLPAEHRPALARAGRAAGVRLRPSIRKTDADSIKEMQVRGLKVIAADQAAWRADAEKAWGKLEGSYCQADVFAEVRRIRAEYRSKSTVGGTAGRGR